MVTHGLTVRFTIVPNFSKCELSLVIVLSSRGTFLMIRLSESQVDCLGTCMDSCGRCTGKVEGGAERQEVGKGGGGTAVKEGGGGGNPIPTGETKKHCA